MLKKINQRLNSRLTNFYQRTAGIGQQGVAVIVKDVIDETGEIPVNRGQVIIVQFQDGVRIEFYQTEIKKGRG